jgi:hypothetical protein
VLQVVRNLAIIALLALGVTLLPRGGAVADTLLAALLMALLAAISLAGFRAYRANEITLASISDGWKAILFGIVGALVYLVGAYTWLELQFGQTGGLVVYTLLTVAGVAAFVVAWGRATSYYS